MPASDLNGAAMPLQTDPDRFERFRADAREAYCGALDDMLEDALRGFLLADERALVLTDAIQFTMFIGILKIAEARGVDVIDRKALMQIYRPLNMLIEREVPNMLMQFVDAKKAGGQS